MTNNRLSVMKSHMNTIKMALGNPRLSSGNVPYMKIFKIDNNLYFGAYTETVDVFLEQFETRFTGSGNFDYKKLIGVLNNLEEVNFKSHRQNKGIMIHDDKTSVILYNYVIETDVTQEELEGNSEIIQDTIENGSEMNKEQFLSTLEYFQKINIEQSEDTDISGNVFYSDSYSFLVGIHHVTKVNFTTPTGISFQLNPDESSVLTSFLKNNENEDLFVKHDTVTGNMYFVTGRDLFILRDVITDIPSRPMELFNEFKEECTLTINTTDFIRYLNISSLFLDNTDEVTCKVKDEEGTVGESNKNIGDGKGKFSAKGVPDLEILINLPILRTILKSQPLVAEHETLLKLELTGDIGYFTHHNGSTMFTFHNIEL